MVESNFAKPEQQLSFHMIREDMLPEVFIKTLKVKDLLAKGEASTVHEAAEHAGISRSAYYKYKDAIFPLHLMDRERMITISIDMEHRSGVLSKVLSLVASREGNVLTIHQTIPLQGMANVSLSIEVNSAAESVQALIQAIRDAEGVRRVHMIGQG